MIFRTEHPKPQFMRESWMNLNGEWQFETDNDNDGRERELFADGVRLFGSINVPFCPESRLSGVEYTDFMNSVWYKRSFTLDAEHLGGRVILHFGAADYRTTVYVNGRECGSHRGGYVSFSFDITDFVSAGVTGLSRAESRAADASPSAAITREPRVYGRRCGLSSRRRAASSG